MYGNGVGGGKASLGIFVIIFIFLRLEREELLSQSRRNRKEAVAHGIHALETHERKRSWV